MAASFAKLKETFIFNFIEGARWKYITNGLWVTLKVTFFALLLGIVIGVVVAMVRSSYDQMKDEMKPGLGKTLMTALNALARLYLTVIRGTPVVVQLLIGYFVILSRRLTRSLSRPWSSASTPARTSPKSSAAAS